VLGLFRWWERRREAGGREPLVHLNLLRIAPLRAGLTMFLSQNLLLMGIFFAIPLYLQIVQGFDAFETGLRMAPVSVALFVTSLAASRLAGRRSPRAIVRAGVVMLILASVLLLATIKPEIDTFEFGVAMAVLGIGMGLIVSQLGNVVQSAVGETDRSEAGGLQYTAQQLGASLGTALIGAVVITGLVAAFQNSVTNNPAIPQSVQQQVGVRLEAGVSFVSADQVRASAEKAGVSDQAADALVSDYQEAQLKALKTGLLFVGLLACLAYLATSSLPARAGPDAARERSPSGAPGEPAVV
jgi:Na+/melibiose symporter-like transporter